MIKVMTYSPVYREQIIALILQIQQEEFGIAITRKDQPDLEAIDHFYQQGGGNFWLAVNADNQVVGSIALKAIANQNLVLRKMFVRQDSRGKEKNVAATLLRQAIDYAQAVGANEIYLGTTDKYLAAHRFYEKNNFRKIDKESLPDDFPLMAVDSVFYAFSLDE